MLVQFIIFSFFFNLPQNVTPKRKLKRRGGTLRHVSFLFCSAKTVLPWNISRPKSTSWVEAVAFLFSHYNYRIALLGYKDDKVPCWTEGGSSRGWGKNLHEFDVSDVPSCCRREILGPML